MPIHASVASDACLAALTMRCARTRRGCKPIIRIPRAATNNARVVNAIANDTVPSGENPREPRKLIRLARRTLLAIPPAFVAGSATQAASAAVETAKATRVASKLPGEWGYADFETGPLRWGEVRDSNGAKAFPDCGCAACAQSPIDITSSPANAFLFEKGTLGDVTVPSKGPVVVSVAQKHGTPNYVLEKPKNASHENEFGGLVLDSVSYEFSSLHFHTPAENTVNGVTRAMEMHLVHFASDGSGAIAVLGVLFEHAGAASDDVADPTVERLLSKLREDGGKEKIKIDSLSALWDANSG